MADKSDIDKELKPISKTSVIAQKALSGTVAFFGACTVALGVVGMVQMKKPDAKSAAQDLGVEGAIKVVNIGIVSAGALTTAAGLVGINVANAASRARKFVQREDLKRDISDKSAQLNDLSR